MIEVQAAEDLVRRHFTKTSKQKVSLDRLAGRILACPLQAPREQPPFDRVAMDGIAVCFNGYFPKIYKIEGMQKAGHPPKTLRQIENAIEVMTGAVLPNGSDTVIPYEYVSIHNQIATLKKEYVPKKGDNIHFQGSDHPQGKTLLNTGVKLTSPSVALIAGQGYREAVVYKYPKIAIVSTGDELIDPGEKCENWQIWRSNSYGIYSELSSLGYSDSDIASFHVGDDQIKIFNLLSDLLQSYRILILSGGVSMGKYDFVHTVMNDLGVKKIFHKIKQKPGKPMYFGVGADNQNIFGLPGNPVSALICMRRYIISGLEAVLGRPVHQYNAVLNQEIKFKKDFSLFKAVVVKSDDDGRLMADPISSNGSGDFSTLGGSDGFLQLPSNKTIYKKGEVYPYFPWTRIS
ncbi:MAG: molybdopterin molybdotransferase MoeA [Halobacteriovoraceae bacterium]|nr:molybdopterin molybdotransferase MoeA [Halobacteriovoraceae bacterium]